MRRKKNHGGSKGATGRKVDMVECPKCGCPNSPAASRCMYCRVEIELRTPTASEIAYYYLNSVSNYFQTVGMRLGSTSYRFAGRAALFTLITVVLSVIGFRFIFKGVEHGGFFNWTVGVLCLAYAGALLSSVYSAIRKL